ncbi:hypothetical protein [Noviherbaspirillum album]|uniref:hypothetical protein n=1 Tax=Noviherbaspirillum album TaxID=3080276 RepID=UPI002DD6269A|nr:hypothetical protein [Noviherbaspirillum sp. CPCC 100848]
MTMQTFVNGQLRALGGCVVYSIIAAAFIAGARWMLPLPYWGLMLLGGVTHIVGRAAFNLVKHGPDPD